MTENEAAALAGQVTEALARGDAAPALAAFAAPAGPPGAVMSALLAAEMDAPVAAVFRAGWSEIGPGMTEARTESLRWYLAAEAACPLPERRALHRAVLARVLRAEGGLPPGPKGIDLGRVAARTALERGGAPGLRGAACQMLKRLGLPAEGPAHHVFTAIHALDLAALRAMLDAWPPGEIAPDLRRALNWGMALIMEFAGIDPWLEAAIERLFQRDPQDPMFAQRRVQLGLHRGEGFAALAPVLQGIRTDRADPNLKSALQYGLWQAQNIGNDGLVSHFTQALQALEPAQVPAAAEAAPPPPAFALPPPGASPADLSRAAEALTWAEPWLDGDWTPQRLGLAWQGLVQALDARDGQAGGWGPADYLAAAQRLVQIDRREFAWITHFHLAPHGQGAPRFGLVDLRLFPVMHDGLMAMVAALCRAGLEVFLTNDPPGGLGPVARLVQLHGRASLEIGQPGQAQQVIDRLAALGLFPDILAIERDNLALHLGQRPEPPVPPSRQGSLWLSFLDRAHWTAAEGIDWQVLLRDDPVPGRFDLVWPDGRLEQAPHATPPGEIRLARVPGLRLVAEDFLIGPGGHALRPDPYHTSAEFPWPSRVMVAAGRRGLRLRPLGQMRVEGPVLVLEAFEALRWRNYYHWIVPMLGRIALAAEQGLLADGRRLVIPSGLSSWMAETLGLVGLGPEALVEVPMGHEARFDDALLLSSVEHVSPACMAALRRRLLGPDPAPARREGPALFLSRKGQKGRLLENEAEIEAMAAEMGFDVIVPQDLGIPGQIRAFAAARGVAGAEGAALSNTIFAPPGTRVLALCCQNDMMPIFNDLAIVLGQHHRKLAGRGQARPERGSRFQPPFHVRPDLARAALQWVLDGPDPARTGKDSP